MVNNSLPGTQRGGRIPPYILPGTPWWLYYPAYTHQYTTLGTPSSLPLMPRRVPHSQPESLSRANPSSCRTNS